MVEYDNIRGVRATSADGILSSKDKKPGIRIEFGKYWYEGYFSGNSKAPEACELCGMRPEEYQCGDFSGFARNTVSLKVKTGTTEVAFVNADKQAPKLTDAEKEDFQSKMRAVFGRSSVRAEEAPVIDEEEEEGEDNSDIPDDFKDEKGEDRF